MGKPISCTIPAETWNSADRPTPKQEAMGYWDNSRQANSEAMEAWANGNQAEAVRQLAWANVSLARAVRVLIDQVPE